VRRWRPAAKPGPAEGRPISFRRKARRSCKTPSGYVQQSPWLNVANKQLELMSRYMTELGMTPAARSLVTATDPRMQLPEKPKLLVIFVTSENQRRVEASAVRVRSALPAPS
jgi:hypothetical protein